MSGELEAAGTAIDGALLGAVVDGANIGPVPSGTGHAGGTCLNCGARLGGAFCAACGQKAHVHRTLSAIWHDILHSVLHFDGKLWLTLPMLLFKPGDLTRRYVHGERAKFVSPMGLFLFAIFLMFAVFSLTGPSDGKGIGDNWTQSMEREAGRLDAEIRKAEVRLKAVKPESAEATALEAKLDDLKSDRNGVSFATTGKPVYDDNDSRISGNDHASLSYAKSDTGWKWLDRKLNEGGRKMFENPSLVFYKIQSNGYKFAWLLIPLSLPFVWLVTLGVRGYRFYDHAVFTTYSISFMCVLFILFSLAEWAGISDGIIVPVFLIAPLLHLYKQLRQAYGLSRIGTLLRMIPLMISMVIVVTLFFVILLMLGIMG